ncbi:MAG: hypothetical protein H7325_09485 [Pedobacter sp.]|nr:hypothetical protein [Pedobacter sp.]
MENEIVEVLNRHTALLKHLISLVIKVDDLIVKLLEKKAFEEQGWYNAERAMEILVVGKKTLYRMRKNHPEQCMKNMGQWYYNLNVLNFDAKGKPAQ